MPHLRRSLIAAKVGIVRQYDRSRSTHPKAEDTSPHPQSEVWNNSIYNSAPYVTLGGDAPVIRHIHRKFFLPTYGLFDEERFVDRGFEIRERTRAGNSWSAVLSRQK